MGLDIHALKFLAYCQRRNGAFGATLTIGRQGIHIPAEVMESELGIELQYRQPSYCEELLEQHFGSSSVESLDYSEYEKATIVHDLNNAIDEDLHEKFDTVIDSGSLEHVFDVRQALQNLSNLTKTGGQIIHSLPANNQCGHGFYQFSPELFFSYYSEERGFIDTEVYLADLTNLDHWFQVSKPSDGLRAESFSSTPLYVLVRTTKGSRPANDLTIQQSDYTIRWEQGAEEQGHEGVAFRMKRLIRKVPWLHSFLVRSYVHAIQTKAYFLLMQGRKYGTNKENPWLTRVPNKND